MCVCVCVVGALSVAQQAVYWRDEEHANLAFPYRLDMRP